MQSPVPVFDRQLRALRSILRKAEEHCAARGIDPSALLSARLFPDMLPLVMQVRVACDHAKGATCRLAGREVVRVQDTEASFDDLRGRIDRTLAIMAVVPESEFEGAEARPVIMKGRLGEIPFASGEEYLWRFALPNFFFHVTTAYNILRHNGVELGKRDFLGVP